MAWFTAAVLVGCGTLIDVQNRYFAGTDAGAGVLEADANNGESAANPDATGLKASFLHDASLSDEGDGNPADTDGGLGDEAWVQACGAGAVCTMIDTMVADMALDPSQKDGHTYVLRTDANLWLESSRGTRETLVDSNVARFQVVDLDTIYVLGTDQKLWNETGTASTRILVDTLVSQFWALDSSNVYVDDTTFSLWLDHGTSTGRIQVASSVATAQGINEDSTDFLDVYGNLIVSNEGAQVQMDANVSAFEAVATNPDVVYALRRDGQLWNESVTASSPGRVDGDVVAFSGADSRVVYVVRADSVLWRENGDATVRTQAMTGIKAVKAVTTDFVYALGTDGVLFGVQMPVSPMGLNLTVDGQQRPPGGPALCASGSGFTASGTAQITYSGVPGQGTVGPFRVTVAANGMFDFADASQESSQISCSASELGASVTIAATDGEIALGGGGNSVSMTISAADWCINGTFQGSGNCTP